MMRVYLQQKETNKIRKGQPSYKGHGNELKQKKDTQKIPLTNANRQSNIIKGFPLGQW